ncbi:LamG-like jellyroll fold domain-containing protein [Halobellus limi]|uniref:Concanavalin A-like lectin/glucanases superfamily protein n=1 Tax=Halobellus limi TaxID=699433 RepID=A0A1H5ZHD8_9EURY|nr:LamG-like jellyroll fold domain-containing protein [Halobellus limi]QCC48101.1 hypothetical protein DV707_10755 [Halobellus limi]SEG35520.1 Concanavalin A-like lectin/glucanases superfamily protein [Halobellus limi]
MPVLVDFEDGDVYDWVGGKAYLLSASTTQARNGAFSGEWDLIGGFYSALAERMDLTVTNADTASSWIYATGGHRVNFRICVQNDTSSQRNEYSASIGSDGLELYKYTNGSISFLGWSGGSLPYNSWIKLEIVGDGAGGFTANLYDSSEVLQASVSGTDTAYSSGGIGIYAQTNNDPAEFYFDDIAGPTQGGGPQSATLGVASASVTAYDVSGSVPAPPTDDVTRALASKWKFDSGYTDSVGTYDATNNGTSLVSGGYIDGAAQFDGSSHIDAGDHATIDSAPWTFAIRSYLTTTTTGTTDIQTIACKNVSYSDRAFWLVEWDGLIQVRVGSNAVTVEGPAPTLNTWQTIIVTYNGSTFELWVDGVSYGTNTETTIGGATAPLRFGSEKGTDRYIKNGGRVDDARVYSDVLTNQEVADLTAYDGTAVSSVSATLATMNVSGATYSVSASAGAVAATIDRVDSPSAESDLGASPGAVSASMEVSSVASAPSGMTASAGPVAPQLGSVSASGTPTIIGVAPGAVSAAVEGPSITSAGTDPNILLAPVSPPLEVATVGAIPVSVSSIVGPTAATVDSVGFVAIPRAIGSSEAVYAALESLGVVGSPADLGAIVGAVSSAVGVASIVSSISSPSASAGPVARTLSSGDLPTSPASPGAVPGPVSADLGSLSASAGSFDLGVVLAMVAMLDLVSVGSESGAWSASPGAVSADLASISGRLGSSSVGSSVAPRSVGVDLAALSGLVAPLSAENVLFLFLRMSETGNSSISVDNSGENGLSVDNSGGNGFELDSTNDNFL